MAGDGREQPVQAQVGRDVTCWSIEVFPAFVGRAIDRQSSQGPDTFVDDMCNFSRPLPWAARPLALVVTPDACTLATNESVFAVRMAPRRCLLCEPSRAHRAGSPPKPWSEALPSTPCIV